MTVAPLQPGGPGRGEAADPALGESWLLPAVLFGLFVTAVAEGLSLFGAFSPPFIRSAWLAGALLVGLLARKKWRRSDFLPHLQEDGWENRFQLAAVAGILFLTLVVALAAPPNTWDSMTYHMSRVVHWIQNGSVYPYPTAIDRQFYLSPWAEYLIAQFQAIAGGDRLANTVQWLAFLGCVAGAWTVAGLLGARRAGKVFAAFLVATTPMAILQATSTQNDLVVSFWSLAVVWLVLLFLSSAPTPRTALLVGGAAGLALLTKGIAIVVLAPYGAWLAGDAVLKRSGRRLALLGLSFSVFLTVCAPFAIRTARATGDPFGGAARMALLRNQLGTAASVVSGLVRNAALHGSVPIPKLRREVEAAVESVHRCIGLDPSDPRTTFGGSRFEVGKFVVHEDLAGSPLHFLLYAAAIPLALFSRTRAVRLHAVALFAGVVLFCTTLRWQPWSTRLHLPFFIIAAPAAAAILEDWLRPRLRIALALLLAAAAAPYVLKNWTRPLWPDARSVLTVPRQRQMFANRPELGSSFDELSRYLGTLRFSRLGLVMGDDDFEYPFWAFVRGAGGNKPRIEHVALRSPAGAETMFLFSRRGEPTDAEEAFHPEVIIWDSTARKFPDGGKFEYHGARFERVRTVGVYQVLMSASGKEG